MVELGQIIETGILVLFTFTQSFYFVVNLILLRFYTLPSYLVTSETPETYRPVSVLVPIYREREAVLRETLDNLRAMEYPTDLLDVYVIYEPDDPLVCEYVDDVAVADVSVHTCPVDRDTEAWDRLAEAADQDGVVPANKARALTYALYHLDLGGIITVLDADTLFPPSLFDRGVAGLETYDVVQAKQTARNIDEGWLPFLEAMGMAAWTHVVYTHTPSGPYQLLGKGYFLDAETIRDVGGWDVSTATEDMSLGIDLYKRGYSLGIVDLYLQDICPTDFDTWVTQKKRWVSGPYGVLLDPELSEWERTRFALSTLVNQMVSVVNIVGVPAGLIFAVQLLLGEVGPLSLPLLVIVNVNAISWLYYTWRSYQATHRAIPVDTGFQRLKYDVLSNMVTQMLYATIWSIPITLAIRDYLQKRTVEFEVTPK